MKTTSKWRQPKHKDNLNNEEDLKNVDGLKNENDPQNEDDLRNLSIPSQNKIVPW